MNTPTKIAGFTVGLAAVFGAAVGVGAAVGPDRLSTDHSNDHATPARTDGESASGLAATVAGYTLDLETPVVDPGAAVPVQFRILDATGTPVRQYHDSHEKQLHVIVVRRDLTAYQHLHPTLDDTGTWTVPVDLDAAGDYRVLADFVPQGGPALTLGADLHVSGQYEPRPLPAPTTSAVTDGYTVALSGRPEPNEPTMLTLSVSRAGKPVTDLQPYLGAYGHLVALRASDLAYLHVHPVGAPGDGRTTAGPDIAFHATLPSAGKYRLFLDFRHNDTVHTAEFTVPVGQAKATDHPQHRSGQ